MSKGVISFARVFSDPLFEEQSLQKREGETKQKSARHAATVPVPEYHLPSSEALATIGPSVRYDDLTLHDDPASLREPPEAQEWTCGDTGYGDEDENVGNEGCHESFIQNM